MTSVTLEETMRSVPAPSFSTELKRVPVWLSSVSARRMSPLAASMRVLAPPVFRMPPTMRRVEPASAPMTAPNGREIRPETVLTPERLCSWPPKLTPPWGWLPVPWRLMALLRSKPPASCRAVPRAVEPGAMVIGPVPAARASPRRTTPALMVRPPVQPGLATGRTSRPEPCLARALVEASKTNGVETVRAPPSCTPSELVAAFRLKTRLVAKEPVTLRPVAAVAPSASRVTELPAAPRAASPLIVSRPPRMSTVWPTPPKVLTPPRTSSPAPSLVRVKPAPASEMTPVAVRLFAETVRAELSRSRTAPAPRS